LLLSLMEQFPADPTYRSSYAHAKQRVHGAALREPGSLEESRTPASCLACCRSTNAVPMSRSCVAMATPGLTTLRGRYSNDSLRQASWKACRPPTTARGLLGDTALLNEAEAAAC
jgi:hypothetical protein